MSHELEHDRSAIYARNEAAWHKLGIVKPDEALTTEMIFAEVPELGSNITASPMFAMHNGTVMQVPGYVANIRDYDGKSVGVVSTSYQLVQPRRMFQLGQDIVDSGEAIWDTAVDMDGGSLIMACMRLPRELTIAGMDTEKMQAYLMLANSYNGSTGMIATASWVRGVCKNTYHASIAGAKRRWSLRHTASIEGRLQEVRDALGLTYKLGDALAEEAALLLRQPINGNDVIKLAKHIMPIPQPNKRTGDEVSDRTKRNIEERRQLLLETWRHTADLDNIRNTKYGALQAVAAFEQHVAPRQRTPEGQLAAILEEEGALFGRARTLLLAS